MFAEFPYLFNKSKIEIGTIIRGLGTEYKIIIYVQQVVTHFK